MKRPGSATRTPLLAPASGAGVDDRLGQVSDRVAYLSRVARTLSGALHTDRAVDLVLDLLTGAVADWAQVTLVEPRGYLVRARHDGGPTVEDRLSAGEVASASSLVRVLSTGVSDLVPLPSGGDPGDPDDPALRAAVPSAVVRADLAAVRPVDLLTIALTARGTTYGALSVARRGDSGYDESAVAFLEDVAHEVSVTIDTTRALADSRRVATVLSRDLAPPTLPALAGVRLASYYQVAVERDALGGDFYDVHGDDEDWTAVMGDVCGKGVEAAVLTGKVRQSVRTAALVDRDPAAVLGLANRVLIADGADTFVTAVCVRGRRDGSGLHLEVATAGHPAPIVVRGDGSVEQLDVSGTVLGLLPETRYASARVRLLPGETCLLYTDGVPEAPGRRSRFGDDRLHEVLRATGACDVRAQVEGVAVAVSTHLRDRAHDDIALLALQATGR